MVVSESWNIVKTKKGKPFISAKYNPITGEHKSNKTIKEKVWLENDILEITFTNNVKQRFLPKAGVIILCENSTKVILVKGRSFEYKNDNYEGKWGFPKGHKDLYETRAQCAKRELYEETGIELDIDDSYPYIDVYNTRYFIVSINYDVIQKYKPIDNYEIDRCNMVSLETIKHLVLNRETIYAVRLKNINYIITNAKHI